jgi:hypothetical protein
MGDTHFYQNILGTGTLRVIRLNFPGLFGKIEVKKSGLYPFANAISLIRFWRRFVLSIICERTPIHSLAGRDEDSANPFIRRAT